MGFNQSAEGLSSKIRGFLEKNEFYLKTVTETLLEFPACWPVLQISDSNLQLQLFFESPAGQLALYILDLTTPTIM